MTLISVYLSLVEINVKQPTCITTGVVQLDVFSRLPNLFKKMG